MSLIIIDDKYYKDAIIALKGRLNTEHMFNYQDFPNLVRRIPQSIAGVDDVIGGIYLHEHDEEGFPTKLKVVGWSLYNTEAEFPIVFKGEKLYSHLKEVEFANCNFKYLKANTFQRLNIEKAIISGCAQIKGDGLGGAFSDCSKLKYVEFKEGLTFIDNYSFRRDTSLTTINLPSSLKSFGTYPFDGCSNLQFVELGQDFNANNLDLAASTKYSRETILQWLNALADRTGQTAYKLIIRATNLKKLTEEDIAIATAKNWTLA